MATPNYIYEKDGIFSTSCYAADSVRHRWASDGTPRIRDIQLATTGWGPIINPSTFSDNGFYETVRKPEGGSNILYTDFSTKSQVYLCNRPECLHEDDSCNSYFSKDTNGGRLFMDSDKSLLISICEEKVNGGDEYATKIVTMLADGSERKTAYELPFNESIEGHKAVDKKIFI